MQMTLRTFYVLISFFATWKDLATYLTTVQVARNSLGRKTDHLFSEEMCSIT